MPLALNEVGEDAGVAHEPRSLERCGHIGERVALIDRDDGLLVGRQAATTTMMAATTM